ncbi:MAG: hypothetical protein ABS92_03885 [Thiobacillus sp. SCN 63-374]|nr:MAG: hypothetical protein ABS92_03885 [Thiobacillus sp. SCN 63-374]
MDDQTAESFMYVARLHFQAMARERKGKALERIKRQRFYAPVAAPLDEDTAAFLRHINEPEIAPRLAAEEELDWMIDSLDPASCRADELDQLFRECRQAGDAERAAYLAGCRDVRMRISLLEGTNEWRELESVGNQSEISRSQQAIAGGAMK